jgi:DNA-directed RNA polymerase sigma subunit (sigma70/sigma32)
MTGKEYFIKIRNARDTQNSLARQVEELRAMTEAIGGFDYAKPNVQSSPTNATEERIVKLVDTLKEYEEAVIRCSQMILEAEQRISELSRTEYAQIVRLRYMDKKHHTWGWISEELGYSEIRIKEIHAEALDEFERRFLKR